MKNSALFIVVCIMLGPAVAESAGEKTGVNSTLGIAHFVTEVAASDMFEIQSSKLAATKTQGKVQAFANQMVTDHTKTSSDLKPLAQEVNVPIHVQLTAKHAEKASGPGRAGLPIRTQCPYSNGTARGALDWLARSWIFTL
jgi:putative membrane protein